MFHEEAIWHLSIVILLAIFPLFPCLNWLPAPNNVPYDSLALIQSKSHDYQHLILIIFFVFWQTTLGMDESCNNGRQQRLQICPGYTN